MLLALKAEAEKAAAPPEPEERVIGDAPKRTSDFGPLALAPGRLKVRNRRRPALPRVLLVFAPAQARALVSSSAASPCLLVRGQWQQTCMVAEG